MESTENPGLAPNNKDSINSNIKGCKKMCPKYNSIPDGPGTIRRTKNRRYILGLLLLLVVDVLWVASAELTEVS